MVRMILLLLTLFSVSVVAAQPQIPADSRLKIIADTKTIKIAYRTDATPYSFLNSAQEPVGYSIDVCKLVIGSIEKQFGPDHLNIEWVPVTVQSRFSAVAAGRADMECGSSTVTLGRMKEVDFSNFIFVETTGVVVSKASGVQTFADMASKKIAVVAGTTNEKAIVARLKQQNIVATIIPVQERSEGVAMLEAGSADAYASDKLLLVGTHIKDATKFMLLPDDLSVEPYAIALPRGDWALRLAVNTGLAQIYGSGEIVGVFRKWFDQIGLQMSPALRIIYGLGALAD
jgi:ABC-type amino acid transport substrate-binding protein